MKRLIVAYAAFLSALSLAHPTPIAQADVNAWNEPRATSEQMAWSYAKASYPVARRKALRWLRRHQLKPCSKHPKVVWVYSDTDFYAWADKGACALLYNARYRFTRKLFCAVTLHEFGHLAGLDHNPNRYAIMYFAVWRIPKRCR